MNSGSIIRYPGCFARLMEFRVGMVGSKFEALNRANGGFILTSPTECAGFLGGIGGGGDKTPAKMNDYVPQKILAVAIGQKWSQSEVWTVSLPNETLDFVTKIEIA